MSAKIEIKGDWKQKFEVGPIKWHNHGTFHINRDVTGLSWSQTQGLITLTEAIDGDVATVTVSAFGHSFPVLSANVVGHNKFKLELDSGNLVEGTVTITDGADKVLTQGTKITV